MIFLSRDAVSSNEFVRCCGVEDPPMIPPPPVSVTSRLSCRVFNPHFGTSEHHSAFGPIRLGILRNPDRTRTRTWTRTRRKPGLVKNPDSCSDSRLRNPDSTIENMDSKSKILDSMKLDSDNLRDPEYIPIFNCLSETYNRNSQILR